MNDLTYAGRHALVSSVSRHTHDNWEFVYCTHGSGLFDFGDEVLRYTRGDVIVIPPGIPHSNRSEGGMRNVFVHMDAPSFPVREPTVIPGDGNPFLAEAFEAAYFHFASEDPARGSFLSLYGALICAYCAQRRARVRPVVVREIGQAIDRNYPNPDWQLDGFLRTLPFSYDYLRKLFQKEMGVTPHRYLSDRRLDAAAALLVSAPLTPVADVARQCGFREPLYFSKMFKKKFGMSPSYYQRQANT